MVKLEISLKRVQTFIFEVPKLKAMLGANALVGQVMRHELRNQFASTCKKAPKSAPKWPDNVPLVNPEHPLPVDPLAATKDPDNPVDLFNEGIYARDGGRFIAVFEEKSAADKFVLEAEETLAAKLPGVLYDIKYDDADKKPKAQETQVLDLPVLQVCQETGSEPASPQAKDDKDGTDDKDETRWVANSVTHRLAWGRKFNQCKTLDVLGLLHEQLYPTVRGDRPNDLAQLATHGYIALIHADGNGIGLRYKQWKEVSAGSGELVDARGEAFFYSMRVAMRRALVDALEDTFTPDPKRKHRPYEVLMLGGDDLLLVCGADKALDFAVSYTQHLDRYKLADGHPLHVAIGVAIAQKTYPLHRLHELAEELASSAKRLYRSAPKGKGASVVDWQVVTQSWFADVAETRRRSDMIKYTVDRTSESLLLTAKPYPVTGPDGLQGLLKVAQELDRKDVAILPDGEGHDAAADRPDDEAARSPLRGLRGACEQGRLSGEMAFAKLPGRVRTALGWEEDKSTPPEAQPSSPDDQEQEAPRGKEGCSGQRHELWKTFDDFRVTRAIDIIDIREIARLGRRGS